MSKKGFSSALTALLVAVVVVVGVGLAYTTMARGLSREEFLASKEALEAALSAVEQAVLRAVAEGSNQTVDVGIDACFEVKGGVLYGRYRGVEVSKPLPDLGVAYVDSVAAGSRVKVCVTAVYLAEPREDVSKYRRVFKVVFEEGEYSRVEVRCSGKEAEAVLELEPVVEVVRVPCDLKWWSGATSPSGRSVRVWRCYYWGRQCIAVSGWVLARSSYKFYAYVKQRFSGNVTVKGFIAARRWFASGAAYLYILNADDPSQVLAEYKLAESNSWTSFEVEVGGFEGDFLVAFGGVCQGAGLTSTIYVAGVVVEKVVSAKVTVEDLVRVVNEGTVPVKVRLKLVSGRGLENLTVALGDVEQVVVVSGEVVSGEGSWITLSPGSSLSLSLECAGLGDFYYSLLVEVASLDGSAEERLSLEVRSP